MTGSLTKHIYNQEQLPSVNKKDLETREEILREAK